jgi:hypothetical protein
MDGITFDREEVVPMTGNPDQLIAYFYHGTGGTMKAIKSMEDLPQARKEAHDFYFNQVLKAA